MQNVVNFVQTQHDSDYEIRKYFCHVFS